MLFRLLSIFVIFCATSSVTHAQKPFEGVVVYRISYLSVPEGMEGIEFSLPQTASVYSRNGNVRLQQHTAFAEQFVLIYKARQDSVYMLFDFMNKRVVSAWNREEEPMTFRVSERNLSKTLLEHPVSGFWLQTANGVRYEAWLNTRYQNPMAFIHPEIKFLPLEFVSIENGIAVKYTAVSVREESLDDTYFALPTDATPIVLDALKTIMN